MKNKILFYRTSEIPYGVFSNFDTKHPIEFFNKTWPSTEHLFQAMKFMFTEPDWSEKIRLAPSPKEAATMGRDRNHKMRFDWDYVKYNCMWMAVHEKFNSYPYLKKLLLDTGEDEIVEHTSNDKIWADGGDGTGSNLLGKILMDIRAKFKYELTTK